MTINWLAKFQTKSIHRDPGVNYGHHIFLFLSLPFFLSGGCLIFVSDCIINA